MQIEARFRMMEAMAAGSARRGVREEMLERALMAFIAGTPSSTAAQMAGIDRQTFLNALIQRGIPMTDESPDDMLENLLRASSDFGDDRLQRAVAAVQARRSEELRAPLSER